MKNLVGTIILIISPFLLISQSWEKVSEASVQRSGLRKIIPNQYDIAKVSTAGIKELLWTAPMELSGDRNSGVNITVMLAGGELDEFKVVEYKMMEEGLQKKFPDFKTFYGVSISDPFRKIRIDYTLNGFRAVISDQTGQTYIDPYQTGDNEHRIIYRKSNIDPLQDWRCETESDDKQVNDYDVKNRFAGDCMLREYRIAVAATGEYTVFHAAGQTPTVAIGQAAIVTAMNRVNQIFEQDLACRMTLVANNDQLVYTNAGSDPYTNSDGFALLGENQTNVNSVIGSQNYDIGHVFSTGGGGVATLFSLCTNNTKARGVTGQGAPINDPFWIDFVAHEIGHQYGGNHTQNNSCERNLGTAVEPGSASTIMGYAGICTPNVQNNSDPYFHAISIAEMTAHIATTCVTPVSFGNSAPSASALSNYTVPSSTPLVLEATASDADANDILTYCWEQMDNETASMPPVSTNTGGPTFRSLNPTPDPKRYLPSIDNIINNSSDTWEVLPSVSRTMDFRVTVRDKALIPGCTDEADMTVTVDGSSGPFLVTNSTVPGTVIEGEVFTLEWDVAGTDVGPVSCSNVEILLSYDGGLTYPGVILASTPNDGAESITIPVGTSGTARIMVKCEDNIFFDINDSDFVINSGSPTFTMSVDPISIDECNDEAVVITINTASVQGFSADIDLSVAGLPGGTASIFSANPLPAGNSSTLTLANLAPNTGVFDLIITGESGLIVRDVPFELTLFSPTSTPSLSSPANSASGVSNSPTLTWIASTNAVSYDLEVSTSPGGIGIVDQQNVTGTSANVSGLNANTQYFWRVKANNDCGSTAYSTDFSFTTENVTEICETFMSTDVPQPIGVNDVSVSISTLSIALDEIITDLDVVNLKGTHSYVYDVGFVLVSPLSNQQSLYINNNICDDGTMDFDFGFDDESTAGTLPCPPTTGLLYLPEEPLSNYDGENANGVWTLGIFDFFTQEDSGELESWGLRVCYEESVSCDLTVSNTNPTGTAALLDAISCASSGSTITIDLPAQSIIDLGNLEIVIDKNLTINSNNPIFIDYSGSGSALNVNSGFELTINNVEFRNTP